MIEISPEKLQDFIAQQTERQTEIMALTKQAEVRGARILAMTEESNARTAGLEMIIIGLCRRAGVSDALINQFMSIPRTSDNMKAISNVGIWITTALSQLPSSDEPAPASTAKEPI
jgi:hypothetical protein